MLKFRQLFIPSYSDGYIALKQAQTKYPNYGKEQGMDSNRWWLKVLWARICRLACY